MFTSFRSKYGDMKEHEEVALKPTAKAHVFRYFAVYCIHVPSHGLGYVRS